MTLTADRARVEPCDWPLLFGCEPEEEDTDCSHLGSLDVAAREAVESMAKQIVWAWSSRRYGICDETIRPCGENCNDWWPALGSYPWLPIRLSDGGIGNVLCGCGSHPCSCGHVSEIGLPGPVFAVDEILLDGLPFEDYRVDDYKWLLRTDGGTWPRCQWLDRDPDEDGTWQISYQRGLPVPTGGQLAAGVLACELAKAVCRDKTCGLPQRVQTVTRQGITVAVLDSFNDLNKGRTGIWMVDSWVQTQRHIEHRPEVWTPDLQRPRTTTYLPSEESI